MAELKLDIDAHVVRQLGDQLITDAEQALLELVKNAFDADASRVRVKIDTDYVAPLDEEKPGKAAKSAGRKPRADDKEDSADEEEAAPLPPGQIEIDDDGFGMDLTTIERGWLTISLSPKRAMKERGEVTGKKRTPLGDKGLGRLATMKLGDLIEIETRASKSKAGHYVSFRWSDCHSGVPLRQVPVVSRELASNGKTGTVLRITHLVDPTYWQGEKRLKRLQANMSKLVSPFEQFQDFRISLSVDDTTVELSKVAADLRNAASMRFTVDWKDKELTCTGLIKLSVFWTSKDRDLFDEYVGADKGRGLFSFLDAKPGLKDFNLKREPQTGGWFVAVSRTWKWEELANRKPGQDSYLDPGPFRGEIDSYDLGDQGGDDQPFSRGSEYRSVIRENAGVRVYRDGFGIRMEEDWLGLGAQWTSGRSYYGLKPANTLGFIAISAKDNASLAEKSDREGFIDTPYSRGFFEIVTTFTEFANMSLHYLRRTYNEYLDTKRASKADLRSDWQPSDAAGQLSALARTAKVGQEAIQKGEAKRRQATKKIADTLSGFLSRSDLPTTVRSKIESALADFDNAMEAWEADKTAFSTALEKISKNEAIAQTVLSRFDQFTAQTDDLYDTVALGLVAQALAHDIHTFVDDLLARTKRVQYTQKKVLTPPLLGYLEAVRATANTLRKHISILDPMMRAARETKQVFRISTFVSEFFEVRKDRLDRLGIEIRQNVEDDFSVRMGRGRLLQVIDNLERNSEYWLRQKAAGKAGFRPRITIDIRSPLILFYDNGPGIARSVENSLFDMFISDKPRSEGHGLGLFIATQLLEREGCAISLRDERNDSKRRYMFEIDLAGVLHD